MVVLHIKQGDNSKFLYETTVATKIDDIIADVVAIFNGCLKVERVCAEVDELTAHGTFLPIDFQGLTDEQIEELHLQDEWGEKCTPSGGFVENKDPIGRRNGKAPLQNMAEVLKKTTSEAKAATSKKQVAAGVCLTQAKVKDALDILRGAVTIVYPMGLPPHDPIRMEFENREDLSGCQASLEVMEETMAQLWLAGKELQRGKKVIDFIGKNEKTKAVVKLQKRGSGPPQREPIMSEQERKDYMMHAFRRQEDFKKLQADEDDSYMSSEWADTGALKRAFHGVGDVSWRPR